jgi:hypothetical protein
MEQYERKSGKWYIESSGELHGDVGATPFRALCITGEATDTDYEVVASVTIVKGTKASIIVFYTVGTVTKYLELVLNSSDSTIKLDKMENTTRTNMTSVSYTITNGRTYECQVIVSSDTTITCLVNGAVVIKMTVTGYAAGRHGFGCDGTVATDYSQFNKLYLKDPSDYVDIPTLRTGIKPIDYKDLVGKDGTIQDYYDYLSILIDQASRFVDGETQRVSQFFQKNGVSIIEYFDGVGSVPPDGLYEFDEETDAWKDVSSRLYLSQRPVLSVTTVEENSADIGDTDVWTATTKYRWYDRGEIVFSASAIPAKGVKNVRITYKAGYTITPRDIEMVCMRLIVNTIHKLIADRTATFVSFARPQAVNFATPDIFTPDIKTILNRYKLVGFGGM